MSLSESSCSQGLYLSQNVSQRFESRFSTVRIGESPSMMMKDMDGSVLGVWVAHGEGGCVGGTWRGWVCGWHVERVGVWVAHGEGGWVCGWHMEKVGVCVGWVCGWHMEKVGTLCKWLKSYITNFFNLYVKFKLIDGNLRTFSVKVI